MKIVEKCFLYAINFLTGFCFLLKKSAIYRTIAYATRFL